MSSEWTVDTVRESLGQQIADVRDGMQQQIADVRDATRQQVADQREATRQQVDDMRRMLDERYATQTKALDAAFKAAEQAVAVALANAEKATGKAEVAAERRFESVNEFRKALTDQTATFLPRSEYDAAHAALADRITAAAERFAALELRLTSRLDRGDGADAGTATSRTERRLDTGQILLLLGVIIAAAAVVVAVLKG